MIKKKYANYNELLNDRLKDQDLAMAYLNEALLDKDPSVFKIALKDIIKALGFQIQLQRLHK